MAGDTPNLDALELVGLTETVCTLDREARLDAEVAQGRPWSPTCRWCATEGTYRMRKQVRRWSTMRPIGHVCHECDGSSARLWVPWWWKA